MCMSVNYTQRSWGNVLVTNKQHTVYIVPEHTNTRNCNLPLLGVNDGVFGLEFDGVLGCDTDRFIGVVGREAG